MLLNKNMTDENIRRICPSAYADNAKSSTSAKYLLIPTSKIMDGMVKHDFIPVSAKQTRSKDAEHAKHVIHFSHRSIAESLTLKQELPLIRVQNSHDGLSSFQIDTGFYRLVCSNGLIMPGSMINSARVIHKIGMEDDVIAASYRVLNSFESEILKVDAMKDTDLTPAEQRLLSESAARLIFTPSQIETNRNSGRDLATLLTLPRRHEDKKTDLWTSFNRIQENAIKGGRYAYSENGSYRKMREVKSIDREKQINVELMTLALEMAKLKGTIAA